MECMVVIHSQIVFFALLLLLLLLLRRGCSYCKAVTLMLQEEAALRKSLINQYLLRRALCLC